MNDFVDLIEFEFNNFRNLSEDGFAIYNVGGGRNNELSIRHVIDILEINHGLKLNFHFSQPREGEPRFYASNLDKVRNMGWKPKIENPAQIIAEFVKQCKEDYNNA